MSRSIETRPSDIVDFWREAGPSCWFAGSEAFDRRCERFREAHFAASRCELDDWMQSPEGALALLILLDQIPRNLFRGSAHAYATDALARHHASRAVDLGMDQQTESLLRPFVYLPFQHSEAMADQERSLELFGSLAGPDADKWARHHHAIIERFGRFPHRNELLGRVSTPSEQSFLDSGGFGG
ncbi:MAG: DUF924 family protein [Pseudomonadota bacterium]|nr:DUF924 family protein [Pseudomonadota bacterium]